MLRTNSYSERKGLRASRVRVVCPVCKRIAAGEFSEGNGAERGVEVEMRVKGWKAKGLRSRLNIMFLGKMLSMDLLGNGVCLMYDPQWDSFNDCW